MDEGRFSRVNDLINMPNHMSPFECLFSGVISLVAQYELTRVALIYRPFKCTAASQLPSLFCKSFTILLLNHSCFQRIVRRSIDNSQPIVELFYVTPHQCIDHCIYVTNNNSPRAKLCHSFVYDYLQHSCRLYDHDGKQVPTILHPADGFDYFKRTAILDQCAGPGSPIVSLPNSNKTAIYSLKLTSTGTKSMQSQYFTKNPNSVFRHTQNIQILLNQFAAPPSSFNKSLDEGYDQQVGTVSTMNVAQPGILEQNHKATLGMQQAGFSPPYQTFEIDDHLPFSSKLTNNNLSANQSKTSATKFAYQNFHYNTTDILQPSVVQDQVPAPNSSSGKNTNYKIRHFKPAMKQSTNTEEDFSQTITSAFYTDSSEKVGKNQRTTLAVPLESYKGKVINFAVMKEIYNKSGELSESYLVPTLLSEEVLKNTTQATYHYEKSPMSFAKLGQVDNFPTPPPFLEATNQDVDEHAGSLSDLRNRRDQCELNAYYVVIGYEIVLPISSNENDVYLLQSIEQSECARYCTDNVGPRYEPLNCSSLNYYPPLKKCEIYSTLAEPHGSGNLVENADSIYAEKFCLSAARSTCQANEIFILHVQKKMNSAAIDIITANSITGCLNHCLNSKNCRAAGFDSERRRCYLYDVSIDTSPNSVIPAEIGWVLIENGCNNVKRRSSAQKTKFVNVNVIRSVEVDWTEWSPCQFKQNGKGVRVRARKCELDCVDGGMQAEFC